MGKHIHKYLHTVRQSYTHSHRVKRSINKWYTVGHGVGQWNFGFFWFFILVDIFLLYFCILFQEFFEFLKKNDVWLCKNALKDWVNPIETQILKFWFLWVFIHPELRIKILRPMEKDLAQSDLPVLSYGQKTENFCDEKCYFLAFSSM